MPFSMEVCVIRQFVLGKEDKNENTDRKGVLGWKHHRNACKHLRIPVYCQDIMAIDSKYWP